MTEDFAPFGRLIDALRPWLPRLVVVGGWAHRLHRFHPLANPPHYLPIRTRDADFAFSKASALDGDVFAALRSAGFGEELFGDDAPPVTHYSLGKEDAGFYAEFLTPLRGDGLKSNGAPDATVATAGITAQKLRYLEILLISPWNVRLGHEGYVPVASDVEVLVPNATSFIVQKLLIHSDRNSSKRAQDVLYIHDTLELFGGALDSLHQAWLESVQPAMPEKTGRRAATIAATLFAELTDTIRDAAGFHRVGGLRPSRYAPLVSTGCGRSSGSAGALVPSGAHRFRLVYSSENESSRGCPSERLTSRRRREASTRDCEDAKVERQPRPRRPHRDWPPGKRV